MKKLLKISSAILSALFALILLLSVLAAEARSGFLPSFLPVGAYEACTHYYRDALPEGSLALVWKSGWSEGDLLVVEEADSNETYFAAAGEIGEKNATVFREGSRERIKTYQIIGRVFYQVDGLGRVFGLVRSHGSVVWAVVGLVMLAVAVTLLTLPGRRQKKETEELIKLFEYYGDKYDKEDANIDY